jgi:hypothetical protein
MEEDNTILIRNSAQYMLKWCRSRMSNENLEEIIFIASEYEPFQSPARSADFRNKVAQPFLSGEFTIYDFGDMERLNCFLIVAEPSERNLAKRMYVITLCLVSILVLDSRFAEYLVRLLDHLNDTIYFVQQHDLAGAIFLLLLLTAKRNEQLTSQQGPLFAVLLGIWLSHRLLLETQSMFKAERLEHGFPRVAGQWLAELQGLSNRIDGIAEQILRDMRDQDCSSH